jgi:hypothetical protein
VADGQFQPKCLGSELSRQIAVDLESDADLDEGGGCPGHWPFPSVFMIQQDTSGRCRKATCAALSLPAAGTALPRNNGLRSQVDSMRSPKVRGSPRTKRGAGQSQHSNERTTRRNFLDRFVGAGSVHRSRRGLTLPILRRRLLIERQIDPDLWGGMLRACHTGKMDFSTPYRRHRQPTRTRPNLPAGPVNAGPSARTEP